MIFKKIRNNPELLKLSLRVLIVVFSFFAVLYAAFLFVLPNVVDINKFTPQLNAQLEQLSGFKLVLKNPKLKTTWRLGVKVLADSVSLKYDNDEDFLTLSSPSVEINLPTLVLGHLNLDKIYFPEAKIALVFTKDKKYTLEKYIIKALESAKNDAADNSKGQKPLPVELRNINIVSNNFLVTLDDKNINKTFVLSANGTKISLSSLSGPLKVTTKGYLGALGNDTNFVDFDIKLQTKLPEFEQQESKKEADNFDFDFNFNPLVGLDMFALQSKLNVDLKVSDLGEKFSAKGYFNLDDLSIKINDYQLPKSFIKTDFDKNTIKSDSSIFISKDEFILAKNSLTTGKKSKIDLSVKTDKISLNNVKNLIFSVLEMFAINNDLKSASATGEFECDFNLKSDFKKVQSSGKLLLKEGNIIYPKASLKLSNINSLLDFNGNKIDIKDTSALLNGSKFSLTGSIDNDTNTDIKIQSDPLKVSDIIKLAKEFAIIKENDIKDYSFGTGTLSVLVNIKGKLQNIVPSADIVLDKFTMTVKSLKMPVSLEKLTIVVTPDDKDKNNFIAKADALNFLATMKNPAFSIKAPKCSINADSKNLQILPFNLALQGSNVNVSGSLNNYMTKPEILLNFNGKIAPDTVLSFVPSKSKKYVSYKGQMPIEGSLSGSLDDVKIDTTISSDSNNYINVIDIKNIQNAQNKLVANLNLKGDSLVLNNIALNSRGANVATLSGRVNKIYSAAPQFAPLNIVVPNALGISIAVLDKLSFELVNNIALSGNIYSPSIAGSANISNISYPPFGASIASLILNFNKSVINAQASAIKLAGSDFSGNAEISSNFGKIITVNSLNFNSSYIDSDAIMKLTASMPNTQTSAGPSLPLAIKKGSAKISKLKSGNIIAQNITSDFTLKDNLFTLSNIVATFADGKITGEATYNISNTKVTLDGVGKSLNAKKAASCFEGGSSLIVSGVLNGIAKLNLRGNTFEQQMRTLNGQVMFDISNGQYGEAARFERFLHAGNLLTQSILNLNLNQTISAVTSRNTGEFKSMEGKISLSNGWANITSFESQGPNMSLYVTGKYNLLTSNSDLKILGRISSSIVSVLGPIGSFSLNSVVNKLPEKGLAILNTIKTIAPANPLFEDIKQSDLDKIPSLSTVSNNSASKDFQVIISGPVTKTTSIKSFKWANKESASSTTNTVQSGSN